MILRVGRAFNRLLRSVGWEVRKYHRAATYPARIEALLGAAGSDLVLDVGANVGQTGRALRSLGYAGRIVSFEPLAAAHQALCMASESDPAWEVAPRMAIGDENGEIEINVSRRDNSSSVLPIRATLVTAAPQAAYVGTERAPLARLDTAAADYIGAAENIYLKADVQGYEMQVLEGAVGIMPKISAVQLELSFSALYEGQTLYRELLEYLADCDYELFGLSPGFTDAASGKLLQADGFFIKA